LIVWLCVATIVSTPAGNQGIAQDVHAGNQASINAPSTANLLFLAHPQLYAQKIVMGIN
jgi:hypothetical protein